MGPRPPAQQSWLPVTSPSPLGWSLCGSLSPGPGAPCRAGSLPSFGSRTVPSSERAFRAHVGPSRPGSLVHSRVFHFHCARGTEHSLLFSCLLSASATRKQALPERAPLCRWAPVSTPAPGTFQEGLPAERGCWQDPSLRSTALRSEACRGGGTLTDPQTHSMKAERWGAPQPVSCQRWWTCPREVAGQVVLQGRAGPGCQDSGRCFQVR